MDPNFMKFWLDLMQYAGQGASAMSAMQQWMEKGNAASSDIGRIFKQAYGIDEKTQSAEASKKIYNDALDNFQQTLNLFMENMGVVSRADHLELVRKYEALKEKVRDQEETIRHLKMLLDDRQGPVSRDQAAAFEKLVKDQQKQFGKLMNSMLGPSASDTDEE